MGFFQNLWSGVTDWFKKTPITGAPSQKLKKQNLAQTPKIGYFGPSQDTAATVSPQIAAPEPPPKPYRGEDITESLGTSNYSLDPAIIVDRVKSFRSSYRNIFSQELDGTVALQLAMSPDLDKEAVDDSFWPSAASMARRMGGSFLEFGKVAAAPWQKVATSPLTGPAGMVGAYLTGDKTPLVEEDLPGYLEAAGQVAFDIGAGAVAKAPGLLGKVARPALKVGMAGITGISAADLYDQYQSGELGAEDTAQALLTGLGTIYTASEVSKLSKSVLSKIGNTELGKQLSAKLGEEVGGVRTPGSGELPIHTAVGTGGPRERSVAKNIKAHIAEGLQEELGEVPVYATMNMNEQATRAFSFGVKNLDRARRIAIEGAEPPEGMLREAVFLFVENKARLENDVDTLKALMNSPLNKRATEMGQSSAYWAQREEFSPVKIGIEAEEAAVERAKRKVFPWQGKTIEPKIKAKTKEIQGVIEATKLPDDVVQKAIKSAIKKAEQEAAAPEEKLAKKVIRQVTPAQAKEMTPEQLEAKQVNELVDELFRIAKEKLPEKGKKPTEPLVERIKRMYAQDEEAQRVYETAKEVVKKRVAEKSDEAQEYLLDALERYDVTPYTRPVSRATVTRTVREEFKKQGVKLSEVVKNRLAVQGATAESVTKGLTEEGFSPEAARYFGSLVDSEVLAQMGKAKASALKQMTNALGKQIYRPTFDEKITKLTNLGALGNEDYIELGRAAIGIESVSNEQLRKVSVLSNTLQDAKAKMLDSDYNLDERMEYGRTWVAMTKAVQALKNPNAEKSFFEVIKGADYTQPLKHPLKTLKDVGGFAKALAAGPDISWLFRQGAKLFADSPREYFKVARKSIEASIKTLGGEEALDELVAEVVSRPNFVNGEYRKFGFAFGVMEEEIPTQLPEKLPIVGRLYKASDAAFEGAQMLARANTADTLLSMAKAEGRELTKDWYKGAGVFVSAIGSRAKLGKLEPVAGYLNNWFFSPRNLKANAQFLTAHLFDPNVPGYLKARAAKNLLTHVVTTATKLYIAKELFGAVIELDPRSANFGTARFGSTRVDFTGGMKSVLALGARAIPWVASVVTKDENIGIYKSSTTDEIQTRETMPYAKNLESITVDFFRNKEAPMAAVITDLFRGVNFENEEFDIEDELKGLFRPMLLDTAEELNNPDSANKLLMLIAEGAGMSIQDYIAPDNPLIKEDKIFQEDMQAKDENDEFILSSQEKFNARFQWRQEIRPQLERLANQKNKIAAAGWQEFLDEWDDRNSDLESDYISPDSESFPKELWESELKKIIDKYPVFARQYQQIPQKLILR